MTLESFFQTFDVALGMLVALVIGAGGGFLLYVALRVWDGMFWPGVIGLVLVLIAAAMLYWRVTILRIVEFFASGTSWS